MIFQQFLALKMCAYVKKTNLNLEAKHDGSVQRYPMGEEIGNMHSELLERIG
jgi:hypothetical protein